MSTFLTHHWVVCYHLAICLCSKKRRHTWSNLYVINTCLCNGWFLIGATEYIMFIRSVHNCHFSFTNITSLCSHENTVWSLQHYWQGFELCKSVQISYFPRWSHLIIMPRLTAVLFVDHLLLLLLFSLTHTVMSLITHTIIITKKWVLVHGNKRTKQMFRCI